MIELSGRVNNEKDLDALHLLRDDTLDTLNDVVECCTLLVDQYPTPSAAACSSRLPSQGPTDGGSGGGAAQSRVGSLQSGAGLGGPTGLLTDLDLSLRDLRKAELGQCAATCRMWFERLGRVAASDTDITTTTNDSVDFRVPVTRSAAAFANRAFAINSKAALDVNESAAVAATSARAPDASNEFDSEERSELLKSHSELLKSLLEHCAREMQERRQLLAGLVHDVRSHSSRTLRYTNM